MNYAYTSMRHADPDIACSAADAVTERNILYLTAAGNGGPAGIPLVTRIIDDERVSVTGLPVRRKVKSMIDLRSSIPSGSSLFDPHSRSRSSDRHGWCSQIGIDRSNVVIWIRGEGRIMSERHGTVITLKKQVGNVSGRSPLNQMLPE